MNYIYLIKYLFSYANYIKYREFIKVDRQVHKELFFLYKALDNIYERFQQDITYEDYALWVQVNLGKDYEVFLKIIQEQDQDTIFPLHILEQIKQRELSYALSQAFLNNAEGKENSEEVDSLLLQYRTTDGLEQEESPFVEQSLRDIYEHSIKEQGFRWRLQSLNRSLGSLRKGDFGVIFARPETGKTTFLASEVSHFVRQAKSPIIWFNNEEDGKKVKFRIIQAFHGLTKEELSSNLDHYDELYIAESGNNLKLYDNASIHKYKVEELCKQYKPSLIVFDQLSKVKGFTNDRDDLRLGSIFAWARELAKTYGPTIAVNQADASGEGKKYLNMDNVAGAKTAIQAEADWILGIGKTHDPGFEFIRHFNISKNKLAGDEDTEENMRHAKIDVLIQPTTARYKDL